MYFRTKQKKQKLDQKMWVRKSIFSNVNAINIPVTLSIVDSIRKSKFRNLRINNLDIVYKNLVFFFNQEGNVIRAVFQKDNAAKNVKMDSSQR